MDNLIHAFDAETGKEIWSYELPAGGQATPMTYVSGGKQYVVIAAGGHGKLGTKQGDYVVAFSLAVTSALEIAVATNCEIANRFASKPRAIATLWASAKTTSAQSAS